MPLNTDPDRLWLGERPRCAKPGTLYHAPTMRTVSHEVFVLDRANFERAEQAIALCMANGLLAPAQR
jgi:hypothetical protein